MEPVKPPAVYAAIVAVIHDLAEDGIGKNRKSEGGQQFQFRGIDDMYNALAPVFAKHKLMMLPRVTNRIVHERQTKSGGVSFMVTVTAEFDLVSAVDGSKHVICTVGEAMDSGDKATNKAMAAAFKYAAMMAFSIPTEGQDHDPDEKTPEPVKAKPDLVEAGKHHPSFDKGNDGKDFSIAIGKLGVQYDALATWLQAGGKNALMVLEGLDLPPSRPSQWAKRYREGLYKIIQKDPAAFIRLMQADEPYVGGGQQGD